MTQKLQFLLQDILKFLFIMAMGFGENKRCKIKTKNAIEIKCKNWNAESKYEITTDLPYQQGLHVSGP